MRCCFSSVLSWRLSAGRDVPGEIPTGAHASEPISWAVDERALMKSGLDFSDSI